MPISSILLGFGSNLSQQLQPHPSELYHTHSVQLQRFSHDTHDLHGIEDLIACGNDWSRVGERFFGNMRKGHLYRRIRQWRATQSHEQCRIFETNHGVVMELEEELYFLGAFGLLDELGGVDSDGEELRWARIPRREQPSGLSATTAAPHDPSLAPTDRFAFPMRSVATGLVHALIVDAKYRVWVCGSNNEFQLGQPIDPYFHSDELVLLNNSPLSHVQIVQVACGKSHSLFLERNLTTLWMCGSNMHSQISAHSSVTSSPPIRVQLSVPLRRIGASDNVSVYLTQEDGLFAAGERDWATTMPAHHSEMESSFHMVASNVKQFALGFTHLLVLQEFSSNIFQNLRQLQESGMYSDCNVTCSDTEG